jgi:predicted dehydrogenase
MTLDIQGRFQPDQEKIRVGFIGCGSHAFRNLFPVFQFVPIDLVATCDLDLDKARSFASQFGASSAYADHGTMLESEKLDAVCICAGYDPQGRPLYPRLAEACLRAGCHVFIEKPPASSCAEIGRLMEVSRETGKTVMVGLKKMFFPANEKAKELIATKGFGSPQLINLQYPQGIPSVEEFERYIKDKKPVEGVIGFLDHLCHPAALLIYLLGMPATLYYERSAKGAGQAVFTFADGAVASLALTKGACGNGGMERTMIVSNNGQHISVENNRRVTLHRMANVGYGHSPSFYVGPPEEAAAVWDPEFSLGQLYNKGLFLLGYFNEINEFARSVLEKREPAKGTLEDAWKVTRIFEAFAEGPGKRIEITPN